MAFSQEQKVNKLFTFFNTMFPAGNIPTREQIVSSIQSGDTSVKTHILNKMYRDGFRLDKFFFDSDNKFITEKSIELAELLTETFPIQIETVKNFQGFATDFDNYISKANLNDPMDSLKGQIPKKNFDALKRQYRLTVDNLEIPDNPIRKDVKVFKGKVPKGFLKQILDGIASIPDEVVRDATIASLLGYRGTDLTGVVSDIELSDYEDPSVPYYVPEEKTIHPPVEKIGKGRKLADPDPKVLGPIMQSIFDRRFANSVDGKLFPNVDTSIVTAALKEHVFPKLSKNVLAQLKNDPKGFSTMRKLFAASLANEMKVLGEDGPRIAAELMGHVRAGREAEGTAVLQKFYTDIIDERMLKKKSDALFQLEKHMADSLKVTTSG